MMRAGGGVILNIASDAAKVPTPGEAVIGGAMAAIVMFTRALAVEGKRRGVRANVLTALVAESDGLLRDLRYAFDHRERR
jgi:NAD(P)-dependent dehydrogenase (short-subunit alcohol dehydrogenase family)